MFIIILIVMLAMSINAPTPKETVVEQFQSRSMQLKEGVVWKTDTETAYIVDSNGEDWMVDVEDWEVGDGVAFVVSCNGNGISDDEIIEMQYINWED
jgi:hypothetical protein